MINLLKSVKVSDIDVEIFVQYARLDGDLAQDAVENKFMELCIVSAISYVKSYTNLSLEEINKIDCITTAVLMVAYDYYSNRSIYVSVNTKINQMLGSILSMHRNLE